MSDEDEDEDEDDFVLDESDFELEESDFVLEEEEEDFVCFGDTELDCLLELVLLFDLVEASEVIELSVCLTNFCINLRILLNFVSLFVVVLL